MSFALQEVMGDCVIGNLAHQSAPAHECDFKPREATWSAPDLALWFYAEADHEGVRTAQAVSCAAVNIHFEGGRSG